MRKYSLLVFTLALSTSLFAQNMQDTTKTYRNEFGLDVTGLIKQIIYFAQSPNSLGGSYQYQPIYYLTYRRKFKCGNIRAAVGGNFSNGQYYRQYYSDSTTFTQNTSGLNARLGWEFTSELSRKWQAFYGLDFVTSYSHNNNQGQGGSNLYMLGSERRVEVFGVSPVLGFRWHMSKRLSLLAEASFEVAREIDKSRDYYTPKDPTAAPMPDKVHPTSKIFFSSFNQPLSVFMTFDL